MTYYKLILVMLISLKSMAQIEAKDILIADDDWSEEKLKMPLSFAKEIDYQGFEDIRFSQGWADINSDYLWTYTFAWQVEGIKIQTVENLEHHLEHYFDGLMLPAKNSTNKIPQSVVIFMADNSHSKTKFIGKIRTYDKFHTKRIINLNCEVEADYCHSQNHSTILFRLSIKNRNHDVWNGLREVKLVDNLCN